MGKKPRKKRRPRARKGNCDDANELQERHVPLIDTATSLLITKWAGSKKKFGCPLKTKAPLIEWTQSWWKVFLETSKVWCKKVLVLGTLLTIHFSQWHPLALDLKPFHCKQSKNLSSVLMEFDWLSFQPSSWASSLLAFCLIPGWPSEGENKDFFFAKADQILGGPETQSGKGSIANWLFSSMLLAFSPSTRVAFWPSFSRVEKGKRWSFLLGKVPMGQINLGHGNLQVKYLFSPPVNSFQISLAKLLFSFYGSYQAEKD